MISKTIYNISDTAFLDYGDRIIKPDGREFVVVEKRTVQHDKFFWWAKDEPKADICLREIHRFN